MEFDIQKFNGRIDLKKCYFFSNNILFIGYIISNMEIKVNSCKVDTILS